MKQTIRAALVILLGTAASAYAMPQPAGTADYGTAADGSAFVRRIDINAASKWINVDQDETVDLVNAAGQHFTWRFDTAANVVPLARVAPPEFLQGRMIDAYVMHPALGD